MTLLRLDHLAISATDLGAGAAWVEERLGVPLQAGGRHAAMGTHNRLLSLGDLYLEVIAIDPDAPAPGRARWFDLDRFAGAPRLTTWIVACDDIAAAPPGSGAVMDLERGDLRWQMAVPGDGRLPFDGVQPAVIRWQGPHPAPRLTDRGVRLAELVVSHPDAPALAARLAGLRDARVRYAPGPAGLSARFDTPGGMVTL